MELFDSHAHLDFDDFPETEIKNVIERANKNNVKYILTIGLAEKNKLPSGAIKIAQSYENIWASVGIHPHDAKITLENDKILDELYDFAKTSSKIVAWGECGLDYHYNYSAHDVQIDVFTKQIEIAKKLNLPLIVHTREADDDTIQILKKQNPQNVLIHCFSGSKKLTSLVVENDYYVSVSGIITFSKSDELKDAINLISLNRILIETDAPFLAPIPFRGKRNEPSYLINTARKLSEIKGISFEELAEITTENTFNFYKLN